jgi:hypothetical protein
VYHCSPAMPKRRPWREVGRRRKRWDSFWNPSDDGSSAGAGFSSWIRPDLAIGGRSPCSTTDANVRFNLRTKHAAPAVGRPATDPKSDIPQRGLAALERGLSTRARAARYDEADGPRPSGGQDRPRQVCLARRVSGARTTWHSSDARQRGSASDHHVRWGPQDLRIELTT